MILGGDLNFYFDSLLEAKGGSPAFFKKKISYNNDWDQRSFLSLRKLESEIMKICEIHISTKPC